MTPPAYRIHEFEEVLDRARRAEAQLSRLLALVITFDLTVTDEEAFEALLDAEVDGSGETP